MKEDYVRAQFISLSEKSRNTRYILEYENGNPSDQRKSPSKCLSVAPIQYGTCSS